MIKQATRMLMLVAVSALALAVPARAIVIEDVLSHHPLVAFVGTWTSSSNSTAGAPSVPAGVVAPPSESALDNLPMPASPSVSQDNMTVEVVPISLPKLPGYVVFAIYLVGAMVFYTMLVLVAQPGPSEYL